MPSPEANNRYQTALLWSMVGVDRYGNPKVSAPEEIKVRWNTTRKEVTGPQGQPITLTGTVIVAIKVDIGSLMWLGTLAQWNVTPSLVNPEIMEVVSYEETPDIKNRLYERQVSLTRYKGTLPS